MGGLRDLRNNKGSRTPKIWEDSKIIPFFGSCNQVNGSTVSCDREHWRRNMVKRGEVDLNFRQPAFQVCHLWNV